MEIVTEKQRGRAVVRLDGRFDFRSGMAFRHATKPLLAAADVDTLVVDFARVSFVDSSALGLLLLLRAQAEDERKEVVLAHSSPALQKVLSVAQFHRIFRLE